MQQGVRRKSCNFWKGAENASQTYMGPSYLGLLAPAYTIVQPRVYWAACKRTQCPRIQFVTNGHKQRADPSEMKPAWANIIILINVQFIRCKWSNLLTFLCARTQCSPQISGTCCFILAEAFARRELSHSKANGKLVQLQW